MKKIIATTTLSLMALLLTNAAIAQSKYIALRGGYNLGMGKSNINNEILPLIDVVSNSTSNTTTHKTVSFGEGINVGANVGILFNDNVGIDIGADYAISNKLTGSSQLNSGTFVQNSTLSSISTMIRVCPSILLKTNMEKINMYGKFGPSIGFGSITTTGNSTVTGFGPSTVSDATLLMDGGLAIGIASAVGCNFDITEKLSFLAEFSSINMSYAPTKGKITKRTVNGVDVLPSADISEKEFIFQDEVSDNGTPPSTTAPTPTLKNSLPFGSLGLNIGVAFKF